jgi:cystathionine beta-lyase
LNAQKVAEYLQQHRLVKTVYYPGLTSHANHKLACKQQHYFGGVIAFDLKEDDALLAEKIVSSTGLFKLAESLGGAKSLICLPAEMTHKSIPREKRYSSGVKDSLIRLSVGLEHADDLIQDLEKALQKAYKTSLFTA